MWLMRLGVAPPQSRPSASDVVAALTSLNGVRAQRRRCGSPSRRLPSLQRPVGLWAAGPTREAVSVGQSRAASRRTRPGCARPRRARTGGRPGLPGPAAGLARRRWPRALASWPSSWLIAALSWSTVLRARTGPRGWTAASASPRPCASTPRSGAGRPPAGPGRVARDRARPSPSAPGCRAATPAPRAASVTGSSFSASASSCSLATAFCWQLRVLGRQHPGPGLEERVLGAP